MRPKTCRGCRSSFTVTALPTVTVGMIPTFTVGVFPTFTVGVLTTFTLVVEPAAPDGALDVRVALCACAVLTAASPALARAGAGAARLPHLRDVHARVPVVSNGPSIAHSLGLGPVAAFDVNAACSGGAIGLLAALSFLAAGTFERVLLVATDT